MKRKAIIDRRPQAPHKSLAHWRKPGFRSVVEARGVPAIAANADAFLGADLPASPAPRWAPESDGLAWSAAEVRPALLAACVAWRLESDGRRTEQEERRRPAIRLE